MKREPHYIFNKEIRFRRYGLRVSLRDLRDPKPSTIWIFLFPSFAFDYMHRLEGYKELALCFSGFWYNLIFSIRKYGYGDEFKKEYHNYFNKNCL